MTAIVQKDILRCSSMMTNYYCPKPPAAAGGAAGAPPNPPPAGLGAPPAPGPPAPPKPPGRGPPGPPGPPGFWSSVLGRNPNLGGGVLIFRSSRDLFLTTLEWMAQLMQ